MQIEEQRQGAVTVLKPRGPIGEADAPGLLSHSLEVLGKSLGRFVMDATDIPYVDSKGLETLLDISERLGDSGQALKLCGTTETLREVLDLTGLSGEFEYFEDVQTAVRSYL